MFLATWQFRELPRMSAAAHRKDFPEFKASLTMLLDCRPDEADERDPFT
jgi:hypothetical protein